MHHLLFVSIIISMAILPTASALSCYVGELHEATKVDDQKFDYCKSVFYDDGYSVTLSGMTGSPPEDEMPIRANECVLTKNKEQKNIITCLCFETACNPPITFPEAILDGSSFRFNADIEM